MSVARGFFDGKSVYTNIIKKQIDINLNFIVDSTNGNGLGIRSLKSNGFVESVFMNTSATPGVINGYTNPNPIAGFALVRFKNNFNYYLGGYSGYASAPTSTSTTSTTAGDPYMITSLGTTTLAQWQAAGLPMGFTPTVGQAFIALATGAIGGTGTVGVPTASQIVSSSVVGDPNQTLNNSNIAANAGASVLVQFNAATSSSVTTLIPTAPANNTVIGMMFRFDGSSVTVDGL
jgi:hypothetical protein